MKLHPLIFKAAEVFSSSKSTSPVRSEQAGSSVVLDKKETYPSKTVSVYGNDTIRTKPAQLSLFAMHDFHGQNIRMERACYAADIYDNDNLFKKGDFFNKDEPIDKLKLSSGDMFLGENENEIRVVNEFLNIINSLATAIGNHECDENVNSFAELVKDRKYKFLGANMHPDKDNKINDIISGSFVVESNGNLYGIVGLVPPDMAKHMKRPEETVPFNISTISNSKEDVKKEIDNLKQKGVNKIIVLSHMGYENDKVLAESVADIDIILGGHTHTQLLNAVYGENLVTSPKGEPVLIVQNGRDGKYIGLPNVQFNELGQIERVQYNVIKTDDFERSLVARQAFEKILGKPEVVGQASFVEKPPKDIYAYENPHCDFILDSLKSELGTDIAIMNSANIRGNFTAGEIDTRDLRLISPFANKVAVIELTEEELVNSIKNMVQKTSKASNHRPGILQVSGLKYEYSLKDGELKSMVFVDKDNKEHIININNPDKTKLYELAADDYCIKSSTTGMGLPKRLDNALKIYDCDKDKFIADYLMKTSSPVEIRSDARIKVQE